MSQVFWQWTLLAEVAQTFLPYPLDMAALAPQ